jgi:hypothetical protein
MLCEAARHKGSRRFVPDRNITNTVPPHSYKLYVREDESEDAPGHIDGSKGPNSGRR